MFRLTLILICVGLFSPPMSFAKDLHGEVLETRHVLVPVSEGRSVMATIKLPKHLWPGQKVPVFMIFGGFESAGKVLELIHPHGPVALASFDYPFTSSRKFELRDGIQSLMEARELFPKTVQGILGLAEHLKKMPEIDPHQIIAIGASFGSPFVLGAAARNPGISRIVIVHGFARVPDTAEHVILRSWLPKYGWGARPAAWLLSRLGWLYLRKETPEEDAQKLAPTQSVLMISAKDDSFIPSSSSTALWDAIQKSRADKSRDIMPGDHLMPGAGRLIDQIVWKVEAWSDRTK
jgi:dienelactone hydrolase